MKHTYTLQESIDLLKDRINATKKAYKEYKALYQERCKYYDIELANKYHRWMMQEYHTLTELQYIYDLVTGKGE